MSSTRIKDIDRAEDILDKEIDLMCANGMKIKTNDEIGKDKNLAEL